MNEARATGPEPATAWTTTSPAARPFASVRLCTVTHVSDRSEPARRSSSFSAVERVKREEAKRRFRETTPGERLESALRLSELAAELSSGRRTRSE